MLALLDWRTFQVFGLVSIGVHKKCISLGDYFMDGFLDLISLDINVERWWTSDCLPKAY